MDHKEAAKLAKVKVEAIRAVHAFADRVVVDTLDGQRLVVDRKPKGEDA